MMLVKYNAQHLLDIFNSLLAQYKDDHKEAMELKATYDEETLIEVDKILKRKNILGITTHKSNNRRADGYHYARLKSSTHDMAVAHYRNMILKIEGKIDAIKHGDDVIVYMDADEYHLYAKQIREEHYNVKGPQNNERFLYE